MLAELTVKEFMEQLSQGTPMPGGGSVAALSGAAAADLVAMVCALTIGKKGYEDSWEELREIEKKAKQAGEELLGAMDEDAQAYSDVVACFRMPKETGEEKKIRAEKIQLETKNAAQVPLRTAETAAGLFDLAEITVEKGNKNAVSDGAIAAMMARNAVLSALYNVEINAVSLKDEAEKNRLLKRSQELKELSAKREAEILAKVSFQ